MTNTENENKFKNKKATTKVAFLFFSVSLVFLYAYFQKRNAQRPRFQSVSTLKNIPLPNVPYQDFLTGRTLTVDQLKGYERTYVHFWGTWCGPCKTELPSLFQKAKESLQEKRNEIFILVAWRDDELEMKRFLSRSSIDVPKNVIIILDKVGRIPDYYKLRKVPETFVYDTKGTLVKRLVGPQDWQQVSL